MPTKLWDCIIKCVGGAADGRAEETNQLNTSSGSFELFIYFGVFHPHLRPNPKKPHNVSTLNLLSAIFISFVAKFHTFPWWFLMLIRSPENDGWHSYMLIVGYIKDILKMMNLFTDRLIFFPRRQISGPGRNFLCHSGRFNLWRFRKLFVVKFSRISIFGATHKAFLWARWWFFSDLPKNFFEDFSRAVCFCGIYWCELGKTLFSTFTSLPAGLL